MRSPDCTTTHAGAANVEKHLRIAHRGREPPIIAPQKKQKHLSRWSNNHRWKLEASHLQLARNTVYHAVTDTIVPRKPILLAEST